MKHKSKSSKLGDGKFYAQINFQKNLKFCGHWEIFKKIAYEVTTIMVTTNLGFQSMCM